MWKQIRLDLKPVPRGFHLITDDLLSKMPDIARIRVGLLHLFLQHTSASLTINENADPDVPRDLEDALAAVAPEGFGYRHTSEGPDDMPAHVKSSVLGCELTIPVEAGNLSLGTWQGVYLCEHRQNGGPRHIVATLWGE